MHELPSRHFFNGQTVRNKRAEMADEDWEPPETIEELLAKGATDGKTAHPRTILQTNCLPPGNLFSGLNRPTAGARMEASLPSGGAPFQLYSLATPNGQKVGIVLEELGIHYDAWVANIGTGEQFGTGFVSVNPNSKIPCAVDREGADGVSVKLWESGSIALYLAEKYKRFVPSNPAKRAECINWVMWQMAGQGAPRV